MTTQPLDSVDEPVTIDGHWDFAYRYYAGAAASRFFQELRLNRRIMGTHCPDCDRVLVPATTDALGDPKAPATLLEDLISLVALVPDPASDADPKDQAAWKTLQASINKANDRVQRTYANRRANARRERTNPPPMIKKVNFCGAADAALAAPKME